VKIELNETNIKIKRKIKGTFATYFDDQSGTCVLDVEELATILSKNWGDIPRYFSDFRAQEIHLLANAFLRVKEICEKTSINIESEINDN